MRINHLFLALCMLAATSCATYVPIAKSVSQPDYNQRIIVEDPEYSIRPNAIGITLSVGLPAAGAAAGAILGPVQKQTADGRSKSTVGSAVFGALVGGGVSYLSGLIAGYQKTTTVSNAESWARKSGRNYVVIASEKNGKNVNRIKMMNREVESHFQVKNIQDIREFALAFPNSIHMDEVFDAGLKTLPRNDMPALADAMPHASRVNDAIERYINESPSYDELEKALARYQTARDIEPLFVKLVASAGDALKFNQRFPNSRNNRTVVANAFRAADNPLSTIFQMKYVFGAHFELGKQDLSGAENNIRKNYFVAQYGLLQQKDRSSLSSFNDKYSWLVYDGKSQDVLEQWWPVILKGQTSGKKVISEMMQLANKDYAAKAGIDGKRVKAFVEGKLDGIIKEQVVVKSLNTMFSDSKELEEWRKAVLTTSAVREDEGYKVLIYGEIKNNSIFDVPVELTVSGKLYYLIRGGLAGVPGAYLDWFKELGLVTVDERITTKKIQVGSLTGSKYAVPFLMSGESAPYAILIDLTGEVIHGHDTNKKGINFFNVIKSTEEFKLEEIAIHPSLDYRTSLSESQMQKQSEWMEMAKNGLPSAKLYNVWRNKQFRQSEWDGLWW